MYNISVFNVTPTYIYTTHSPVSYGANQQSGRGLYPGQHDRSQPEKGCKRYVYYADGYESVAGKVRVVVADTHQKWFLK